jgi:hypothetical protein
VNLQLFLSQFARSAGSFPVAEKSASGRRSAFARSNPSISGMAIFQQLQGCCVLLIADTQSKGCSRVGIKRQKTTGKVSRQLAILVSGNPNCKESNTGTCEHDQEHSNQHRLGTKSTFSGEPSHAQRPSNPTPIAAKNHASHHGCALIRSSVACVLRGFDPNSRSDSRRDFGRPSSAYLAS